jgi:site-specific recombinase XerD
MHDQKFFTDQWLQPLQTEMSARKYSRKTQTAYIRYNADLCNTTGKTPDTITTDDIRRYLAAMNADRHLSASSMNAALSAFKFYYNDVLGLHTADDNHRPRKDKPLPTVITKDETADIIAAKTNPKHRLLLTLVYSAGLRVSEAVNLKLTDIDMDRKTIFVKAGKGRKDRYTILSSTAAAIITDYLRHTHITTWLFPGQNPRRPLSIRSAQHIFEAAIGTTTIDKPASIHTLRHAFATHLLEAGTDIHNVQQLLGHASVKTTERYTRLARTNALAVVSPLDA